MPKISVVTTLYNQGKYLSDAVKSLENQTFTDWECVIVDDGSTDDSLAIAERIVGNHAKFKLLSKTNSGVAGARNYGIKNSQSEYLAYLDSDDWLYPDALEVLHNLISRDREIGFASCRVQETNMDLANIGRSTEKHRNFIEDEITCRLMNEDPLARVLWNNPTKPGAEIWRTDRIAELLYDEKLRINEDWDILLRHAIAGGLTAASLDVVVKYRRHSDSLIHNQTDHFTTFDCFIKNFYATRSESIYSKVAELATVIVMRNCPEDHVCWKMLNRHESEYLDICNEALSHPTISKFATLWLGGFVRRHRTPSNHRFFNLVSGIKNALASKPFTYWVISRRFFEQTCLK
jgi:glycosyltransferase involved in cell wall biosynthesis